MTDDPFALPLDGDDGAAGLDVQTSANGPDGHLPLTETMLSEWSSGDLFGLTQNAGMGWPVKELLGPEYLILSTQGGIRQADGRPTALGFHTGHWEVGLLATEAARVLKARGGVPFAAYCSDPCDGRTQGTTGMFDSLAYRNDASVVLGRLIRSLPRRAGIVGIATCDKGLPAMMMALAASRELPAVLVPGGVTLPPTEGEDAGKVQTIGARFAHGEISLEDAAEAGCRACASPGGGCQFLGTAGTAQVVAEALGMTVPHAALAPSGQGIWLDVATRSAELVHQMQARRRSLGDVLTPKAIQNALCVHAACGGSTNLILHLAAVAHAAGLAPPSIDDWTEASRRVRRFVDVLPHGPTGHPTIRLYLAGGVPEVMLKLRELGALHEDALTASGLTWGELLDRWSSSPRRARMHEILYQRDGVRAEDVIMTPARATQAGMTGTLVFPRGNLAPEGSVIKATSLDPSLVNADGVFEMTGRARIFVREPDAMAAIKSKGDDRIKPGDVLVLIGRGPTGAGMEETYQLTSALRHLSWGRDVAVITDARFSGVSTGACVGHVAPEALAGGPIGRVRDGDQIRIRVDGHRATGGIDLVGDQTTSWTEDQAEAVLAERGPHPELAPDPELPPATRLWAALQDASGGTWSGCVYDVDRICRLLEAGKATLANSET